MTKADSITPWEQDDAASQRAADFFARRRLGEWGDADQAEFDVWLVESTLHRVAWLRVESAFARTEHLYAFDPRAFGQGGQNLFSRFVLGHVLRRRFLLPLLMAASVALIATVGAPFVIQWLQPPDRMFSTDVGGRTMLKFADGTEVELNSDTSMRFRMTTAERTVWLDRGEAWLHVAHDAAKPFTLIVGTHRVVDLGTEFVVRRDDRQVEVTLLNGRAMLKTQGTATALLKPGDDAIATPVSVSVTRKTPQELADELAWRRGMLVFHNRRLDEVVREINRYNSTKLVIADPSIAGVKVFTDLRADDYEGFVRVAEMVLNLHVDREGSEILISRGSRKETKRAVHVQRSP
jgi:transmembrane sensor